MAPPDLNNDAQLELYQFGDSPCCMKVRIALAEKGLVWQEHFLKSWQFDHLQPDYLTLNPHGTVPTLVHNGQPIIQSNVIVEYLDDCFPEPVQLKPESPLLTAKMRQWMFEEQDHLFKLIIVLSFNTMMKLRINAFGLDQLTEWSTLHPDQEKAQDYLRRVAAPVDTKAVERACEQFQGHMTRLEAQLVESGGPWVCGEMFTLADVCLAPILDRIEYLDLESLWQDLPAVRQWFADVKQRPSYINGVHPFKYRMWGPKKPFADYPFNDADYPVGRTPS